MARARARAPRRFGACRQRARRQLSRRLVDPRPADPRPAEQSPADRSPADRRPNARRWGVPSVRPGGAAVTPCRRAARGLAPPRSARGAQAEIRSEICSAGQIRIAGQIGGQIGIGGPIRRGGEDVRGGGLSGAVPGGACGDSLRVIGAEIPALLVGAIRRVPTRSQPWGSAWTLGLAAVPGLLRDTRLRRAGTPRHGPSCCHLCGDSVLARRCARPMALPPAAPAASSPRRCSLKAARWALRPGLACSLLLLLTLLAPQAGGGPAAAAGQPRTTAGTTIAPPGPDQQPSAPARPAAPTPIAQ